MVTDTQMNDTMARNANPKVKGGYINGLLRYIEHTRGVDGVEQCLGDLDLAGLSEGDIEDYISDERFYPVKMMQDVVSWIRVHYGSEHAVRSGVFLVKNLGDLQYLTRHLTLKETLEHLPDNFNDSHDFGRMVVECKDDWARITIHDDNLMGDICFTWEGILKGLLEITKTKGKVVTTQCHGDQGGYLQYRITYQPA